MNKTQHRGQRTEVIPVAKRPTREDRLKLVTKMLKKMSVYDLCRVQGYAEAKSSMAKEVRR